MYFVIPKAVSHERPKRVGIRPLAADRPGAANCGPSQRRFGHPDSGRWREQDMRHLWRYDPIR